MKKKILAALLAAAMVISMAACGGSNDKPADNGGNNAGSDAGSDAGDAPVTLHFGSTQGTTHAWYEAAENFKANCADFSGGSIDVSVDFGGVWGSDKENAEAVQNGTIDMYLGSTVGFDTICTPIGFVNLPYLVTTYDDVDSLIYNGWIGETVAKDAADAGFVILGMTDCDFRWVSNSVRTLNSGADIKGMKIRVPETPMFMAFFENLGATPTAMAFTELPSALQQGTVDGQDNGPTLSYPNGLYEFNQYWAKTNHSFASAVIAMNPGTYAKLSDAQKDALQKAVDQMVIDCKTLLREDVVEMSQAMVDAGCEVIEPSDALIADMDAAAQKVWADDNATGKFDVEAMDRIRANGGAH